MPLHTLPKLVRRGKRVGRGVGGRGAKSGRGQKGQRSRAGFSHKLGFEGGQTPLYMRLPKGRGMKQVFSPQGRAGTTISVKQLNGFKEDAIVGPGQLRKAGIMHRKHERLKLVAGGKLTKKLTVRVHAATAAAKKAVQEAGGKVEVLSS